MRKYVLVIIDGGADKKSAFAAASKPYLDHLAANSACGIWSGPHAEGYNPRSLSGIATLEIFGYSAKDEPGRGYLEILGLGLKPEKKFLYFRGNFATVVKRKMKDRRAGRDTTGLDVLVKDLNRKLKPVQGIKMKIYRLPEHRVAVQLSGPGLSKDVTDNDIGDTVLDIKKTSPKGRKTAEVLNNFMNQIEKILSDHKVNKKRKLPANFILIRSPGSYQKVQDFRKRFGLRACVITGHVTLQGTARYVGMDIIKTPETQLEQDLPFRVKRAIDALDEYDLVVLHINGADTLSHDKKYKEKVKFIEKIDREVFSELSRLRHINIGVICDHITNSKTGEHLFGSVPFLVYNCEEDLEDNIHKFDEKNCERGFVTQNPMKKLLEV